MPPAKKAAAAAAPVDPPVVDPVDPADGADAPVARPVHTRQLCGFCGQSDIPAEGPVHFSCAHGAWDI